MALYTKSIYSPREERDGVRISVMSRHTLSDGKTEDARLSNSYDIHWVTLAPSPVVVGAWYRREIGWAEFCRKYNERMTDPEVSRNVSMLTNLARKMDVTILCAEDCAEQCHRGILAEECKKRCPELRVEHR